MFLCLGFATDFIRLLLVVDKIFIHVKQALVVVHVFGQIGLLWVFLEEGVSCRHSLLHVVKLRRNTRHGHNFHKTHIKDLILTGQLCNRTNILFSYVCSANVVLAVKDKQCSSEDILVIHSLSI